MNTKERIALYGEYPSVLNTLVSYHLANGERYDYIFCDYPGRLTNQLTPEVERAEQEGVLHFRESSFYAKISEQGELRKWRVKEANMTAVVGTKCEIAIEIYRNAEYLGRGRGDDIGIELSSQDFLDNEDKVLEYLSQAMWEQKGVRLYGKPMTLNRRASTVMRHP